MDNLQGIVENLTKCAIKKGADQAEAFAQRVESREVWIESNKFKTVKSAPSQGIGLRIIRKNALGFASISSLEDRFFDELCEEALAIAKANLNDKHLIIPEASVLSYLKDLYDPKLAALQLKEVISKAKLLLETARGYDKRVTVDSGGVFVNVGEKAVSNSNGLKAYEAETSISTLIMGMARDKDEVSSFSMEFDGALDLSKIKIEQTAKKFAENVIRSLGARPVKSFKGTVLFSPNAVAETLLFPVIFGINSQNVQKGMSRLSGKLGSQIASKILSIEDNGILEGGLSSSTFDREGQPHQKTVIAEDGILKTYLYNSYTAKKDNKRSTGHASGSYRSLPGIGTTNLVIREGSGTKKDLIKEIKEGILVTRFSGNSNPINGDFSGTVKGGFYIKNGKLDHPITNTMIAGNVFEAILNITSVSKETQKVFSNILPYITVEGISITSS